MQTSFNPPSIVQQVSDNQFYTIPWNNLKNIVGDSSYAISSEPLYTISGLWMERFRSKTNQIWATGFNFSNLGTVTGIEIQTNVLRQARVEDLVIQLTINGELIGQNYAIQKTSQEAYFTNTKQAGDFHVYGGSADMWGTTLTAGDIVDPTFGVVLSYQSNETLPHRDITYLNQVAIRIICA